MLVEYVSGEASMGTEHLPRHGHADGIVLLCDEADMVPLRIKYDIFIGLLKAEHDVHQLQLPLDHDTGLEQNAGCWMSFIEQARSILGNVYR